MTQALAVPPLTSEDCLPDDRAVWRQPQLWPDLPSNVRVSIDHGNGWIERRLAAGAAFGSCERWRFGWASNQPSTPFEGLGLAAKE